MRKGPGKGWHDNPMGHRLASYGISMKAEGSLAMVKKGRVPINRAITEEAAIALLPDKDVWENWGDEHFDLYGGTAVRRDSSGVEIIEVTPLTEFMARQEVVDKMMVYGGFGSREVAGEWLDRGNTPYQYDRAYVDFEDLSSLANNDGLLAFTGDEKETDPKNRIFHTITAYIPYYGVGRIKFAMNLKDIGLEEL